MIVSIENEFLTVKATTDGGTLTSVFDRKAKEELLYQPRPDAWDGQDVVIFPFVARLKDKYYELDGKRYDMEIHGLARYGTFTVEKKAADCMTLLFIDNAETRKQYPFAFELRVTYTLEVNKLVTSLSVFNPNPDTLPFMLGAHPAYRLDAVEKPDCTDTSGNYLLLPRREYTRLTLAPGTGFISGEEPMGVLDEIELTKEFFQKYDTLMLTDFEGDVTLKRRGRSLRFSLGKVPLLALWTHMYYGDYVCIEPWFGQPDDFRPVREFRSKTRMNTLDSGKTFTYTYSVEYIS